MTTLLVLARHVARALSVCVHPPRFHVLRERKCMRLFPFVVAEGCACRLVRYYVMMVAIVGYLSRHTAVSQDVQFCVYRVCTKHVFFPVVGDFVVQRGINHDFLFFVPNTCSSIKYFV